MSILLALCAGSLAAVGTYLVLQRTLSRIVVGIALLSHATTVLWITAGRRGRPPIVDGAAAGYSDPFPQALALTAIVITFGVTTFLLALAYRSWELTDDDEVEHDLSDVAIRLGEPAADDAPPAATDAAPDQGQPSCPPWWPCPSWCRWWEPPSRCWSGGGDKVSGWCRWCRS